jgi:hypothetical protein
MSIDIPVTLALLRGLEKLNAGRGSRVPPTDISELFEGDLGIENIKGDIGDADIRLPEDNVRCGDRTGAPLDKPSSELSDIDLGLGVLCAKGDLGGANARES